jgi:hypothetical protein
VDSERPEDAGVDPGGGDHRLGVAEREDVGSAQLLEILRRDRLRDQARGVVSGAPRRDVL